jgi:hypothetical protein
MNSFVLLLAIARRKTHRRRAQMVNMGMRQRAVLLLLSATQGTRRRGVFVPVGEPHQRILSDDQSPRDVLLGLLFVILDKPGRHQGTAHPSNDPNTGRFDQGRDNPGDCRRLGYDKGDPNRTQGA